jgi:hypothetical protein
MAAMTIAPQFLPYGMALPRSYFTAACWTMAGALRNRIGFRGLRLARICQSAISSRDQIPPRLIDAK